MPKFVLCLKEGENPGKFFEESQIPAGWTIDREMPKKAPDKTEKEQAKEIEMLGIAITETLPPVTEGLDITGQPDSFKEGDVIGEGGTKPPRKKPGPKPKVKPEE